MSSRHDRPSARPRVLVVGHLTHDRNHRGLIPGGCAFYAGQVYRRLAADVHLAVTVGEDFEFDGLLSDGACTVTRTGRTTVFANIYPTGDRPRVQLLEAAAPEVTPTGVPAEMLGSDIVHLAPVISELDIETWVRATSARLLAINVQGWVRRQGNPVSRDSLTRLADEHTASWARGYHVESAPWDVRPEALDGVHVAFLSEEDLIGQGDLLNRLCAAIPVVVLTRGSRGCDVIERHHGGARSRTHVGAYPTTEVEATGAGDTFAAGFLYRMATGDTPVQAARFGAAAASIIVEGEGASTLDRLHEAATRVQHVSVTPGPK